ncbi:hypothetical protein HPB52_021638 [Rhipicephalus sanguineus]|uniref:CCHC-type domain-containing protein n=1 Tax=Rhipicephalus sanguineus TaxID=34632 RepID=A0A9D4Q3T6_RHISA|nr:hypothetical protein HPB52_021638 [Rhipicephalus sanguineus]
MYQQAWPVYRGRGHIGGGGLDPNERNQDTMCPNPLQNIMFVSTPSQENVKRYVNAQAITVACQEHDVSAYVAAPNATCKAVIRGIPLSDGPEAIDHKIVNERNPLALGAKGIMSTGVTIVLFVGYKVPYYVSYGGTLINRSVCYACGRLGHRSDICPTPDASGCKACREAMKLDEDEICKPICSLCGDRHLTASRDCKHGYQTPYVVRRTRDLRARATQGRWLSSTGPDRTITSWRPMQIARKIQTQRRQWEPLHILGAAGYKYAPGLQLSAAVHANEDQGRRKSNLTWPDRVRSSDAEQRMQCDPPPELARDADVSQLRK